MNNIHNHKILILDFGSQYTQLIARRVREIGVYCELWAWMSRNNRSAILTQQVLFFPAVLKVLPKITARVHLNMFFNANVPVLGICYGMQTMAMQLGGLTESSDHREFGYASVALKNKPHYLKI